MAFLFYSDDLDGALNMALDEVLWHEAAKGAQFVRLYTWVDRPVLSLGYFQDANELRSDPRLRNLNFVRRLTGGGAIVHDDEITYSVALSAASAPGTNELYEIVHQAVASALCELGVPAVVGDNLDTERLDQDLCFARSDRYAIRVNGVKILGSAQRRRSDRVLVHGSLILGRSDAAPEIAGLRDLMSPVPDRISLQKAMTRGLEKALNGKLDAIALPANLRERAVLLARNKYSTREWNERIS